MDRVRLGRVLGRGARLAARTAYEALDAATSPDPVAVQSTPPAARAGSAPEILRPSRSATNSNAASAQKAGGPATSPPTSSASSTAQAARAAIHGASRVSQRVARASHGLSALDPVKRASRAVSLEVTGSFFALFAFSFALGAWRFAEQMHRGGQSPYRFVACCVVASAFAWFAISNFARARRL